jgi:hypothetical protein
MNTKQIFILGQRIVQKHSDVDRSRAVVAELGSSMNIEKFMVKTI